jgi:hypothetical protein
MTAALIVSLLLGTPVSTIGPLQIAALAGMGLKATPKVIATLRQLDTPAARAWAARNGEAAINLQPGISTER